MRKLSQHLAVREAAYTIFGEYSVADIFPDPGLLAGVEIDSWGSFE